MIDADCKEHNKQMDALHEENTNCINITDMVHVKFTFMLPCIVIDFFLNNQQAALIKQIYSVTKLYMFLASSLPIIRSFLQYIWHW